MEDDSDELSDIEMLEDINQDHAVDNLNLTFNSEDHSIFNEKNIKVSFGCNFDLMRQNTLQTSNISNVKTDEPVCIKDKFPYKHVHSGF